MSEMTIVDERKKVTRISRSLLYILNKVCNIMIPGDTRFMQTVDDFWKKKEKKRLTVFISKNIVVFNLTRLLVLLKEEAF